MKLRFFSNLLSEIGICSADKPLRVKNK